ncbi:tetracycline transporter [Diplocarpon rosae]|nr:tetracycline transporter [Diplocarpon rosae]
MPKEKSVNPAQAARKAEKAKAIKKGKAEAQHRRNEKLAKRNPAHLEKELADLKSLETAGTLTAHEKSVLEGLERDLKAKRRERIAAQYPNSAAAAGGAARAGTRANSLPLGANERRVGGGASEGLREKVVEQAKTVYEAKPAIRDLRKEATSFVPAAVRMKLDKARGVGGLVEPEEADVLERAGYLGKTASGERESKGRVEDSTARTGARTIQMEEVEDEDG